MALFDLAFQDLIDGLETAHDVANLPVEHPDAAQTPAPGFELRVPHAAHTEYTKKACRASSQSAVS